MIEEIKEMEARRYEDEIDLYELIEILMRHRCSILATIIFCTILSIGGALYVNSKAPHYLVKNILIQQENYGLKGVNKIDVDTILLQDKNVEKIFEIEPIREEYLKNTPENMQNLSSKRKFLQKIMTITKNDKKPEEVLIKVEAITDEDSSREVIERYLEILREQDNLADIIEKEKIAKNISLEKVKMELEEIQNEILNIFKNDDDLENLKPEEKISYISSKYPKLDLRKSEQEKYYNNYVNELIKLDSLNDEVDIIKETTDIYSLKEKSKAKIVLVVGMAVGVFLGAVVAFVKEFIYEYKKRCKNN